MFRYVLFDLDNTLYPSENGLWEAIGERIALFMTERMRLPPDQAAATRRRYLKAFGTTLNGLRLEYAVDPLEYLRFVHDLPLANYLRPLPELEAMLARLPQTKVIFTNADRSHAVRVLDHLGIRRHFSQIIDILTLDFVNKPDPRAYALALEILGAAPSECVFVEDTSPNLQPAHALGMRTVLLGPPAGRASQDNHGVDFHIGHILELEGVLAGLTDGGK